jgi:hypothetical protein
MLEWYKLHRAHELELNKATLAYELELAKLLVLLNGGAAGAFLTMTGAIWKEGTHPAFAWVAGAIAAWLFGLLAAAIATDRAYKAQREYTKAYRFRRQGEELRQIEELKKKGIEIDRRHLGIGSNDPTEEATVARTRAEDSSKSIRYFRYPAVVLFVLGVGSALSPSFCLSSVAVRTFVSSSHTTRITWSTLA